MRSGEVHKLFSLHVFRSHHIPDLRVFYLNALYLDLAISNCSFDVALPRLLATLVDAVLLLRKRCDSLQNYVD